MTIWRLQLKTTPEEGITYRDVLNFCVKNDIIGVGWCEVNIRVDNYDALKNAIENIPDYANKKTGKFTAPIKAINAVREMRTGDLVWTRLVENGAEYYLCRVGENLWTDSIVTAEHRKYDIGNYVSAKWVKIGTEDQIPGKVANSFCPSATVQRVKNVEKISQYIWNTCSKENTYSINPLGWDDFWNLIDSEELECLVLLYLQTKGYYIYSSTLKISTPGYETIMISKDGSHRCLPQVKREESLKVENYIKDVQGGDEVYLFTTSEYYGSAKHKNIHCITKNNLKDFILKNKMILPDSVKYWVEMVN